jgi:hypothetical protein
MDRSTASTVMKNLVFSSRLNCVYAKMTWSIMMRDEGEYSKDPVAYNSARRKCVFQYVVFILWVGINYPKSHFTCVEDSLHALFPPFDGKIMGFKRN